MPMFKDIRGDRYGRLVVIDGRHDKRNGTWRVRCQCDCGAERIVQWSHLRGGKTKSCGCFKRDGNGHRVSAEQVTKGATSRRPSRRAPSCCITEPDKRRYVHFEGSRRERRAAEAALEHPVLSYSKLASVGP